MLRIYRTPGVRLYFIGDAVSSAGDFALWLAIGVWVKELTGSSSAAGLTFFMMTLGTLTSPLTGMIVDRHRRKPLLIAVYLVTALLVLSLTLVQGRGQLWLVYTVMALYGVSGGVSQPAQTALLPQLVDDELLPAANSALQLQTQGFRLITPLIGVGLLTWLGGGAVALIDAVSFAVAAVLLWLVPVAEEPPVPSERRWAAEAAAGLRHIYTTLVLRQQALACGVALLVVGFFESVAFSVVAVGLHRPASFVGVIVTVQGVGAVAGGLTATRIIERVGTGLLLSAALAAVGLSCLLMSVASVAVVLASSVLLGTALPWLNIALVVTLQRNTPPELMGRVDGAFTLLVSGPQAISIGVGAGLVALVPYRDLLWGMTATLLCSGTWLASRRAQQPTVTSDVPGEADVKAVIA